MPQLTRGLKLTTSCKIGEKIFRGAVVHLFTCTQTLAIVQTEILQVSQQLFGFFSSGAFPTWVKPSFYGSR